MQQVRPYLRDGRHNINRYIYIIQLCRYTVVHEYKKILEVCNTALSSFPSNHPNIRSLSFVFLFNKITACIPLERLDEAKRIARETIQIVPKGNFNWHLVFLRRITACFHGGEYQEAYQLYKEYEKYQKARKRMETKNGKQAATYPIITEHWEINRGYLYFLNKVGLVHEYEKERFYLGKFLNEVPVYSKDKAGNNINILLIQILVQLFRGQYGKIIDRIKSLSEYVRLYTRNEETKRANIFIKMIIKMESARFHRKGTELKTKKLLEQLKNTPLRMGQNLAIEIVPYEVLWSEILDIIDNKFRISASKASQQKIDNP